MLTSFTKRARRRCHVPGAGRPSGGRHVPGYVRRLRRDMVRSVTSALLGVPPDFQRPFPVRPAPSPIALRRSGRTARPGRAAAPARRRLARPRGFRDRARPALPLSATEGPHGRRRRHRGGLRHERHLASGRRRLPRLSQAALRDPHPRRSTLSARTATRRSRSARRLHDDRYASASPRRRSCGPRSATHDRFVQAVQHRGGRSDAAARG